MALNAIMDSLEGLSEEMAALYTEKNGKFELTGIAGVKTQADIDRLQTSLHKAQGDNKELRDKFKPWAELNHEEVMANLDRLPELEAAAKGNLDEAQIEEMVTRRVDGTLNSRTAPLDREIKQLREERDQLLEENTGLKAGNIKRKIHDDLRSHMTKSKVIPEAQEDVLMLSERIFEVREDDGAVVTRDGVGVTPGISADVWLTEMQDKRPHWWPGSGGGGAGGSGRPSGGMGQNPWSNENWNMTKQSAYVREHGMEKAEQMAKAAGTKVGGLKPQPKK